MSAAQRDSGIKFVVIAINTLCLLHVTRTLFMCTYRVCARGACLFYCRNKSFQTQTIIQSSITQLFSGRCVLFFPVVFPLPSTISIRSKNVYTDSVFITFGSVVIVSSFNQIPRSTHWRLCPRKCRVSYCVNCNKIQRKK